MQKERKGSKMKKLLAMATSLALLATSAIVPMTAAAAEEKEVTKPEKITIMVDTTLVNQANGRDAFEARWEKLTGIDLVINQPDHSAYYDVMQQTMADPDQWPDVLIMSSTYYSDFAANGALWDMTEAWENSNTKNSGRFTGDSVIEGLKINGHLYGFSPARGNGCVTYVKKAWMDKAGITKAPTNWEEYAAMLDAFSKLGVDGKTTYGTSAAGFIGNEAPYTNYLPEFYQDAYPSFILKDGVYVDGFTQPEMEAALARLKEGYDKGWIDPTTLTNSTKDCRNKFYDEQFGVFTYWAGTWATNLKTNLEANGHDSELIALPPIAEVGAYFDRIPPVWCITSTCENPEGVFAYFIDTMLDGGDMQMLWTYGAEGTHWSRAAETVLDKTYEEGQFHFLENLEKAGTLYTKNHIDPMLSLASFAEGYPDPKSVKEEARAASELFNANSKLAAIVPTTEEMGEYGAELTQKKNDTDRIGDIVRRNPDRLKLSMAMLATMRGIPQIFSGDEMMFTSKDLSQGHGGLRVDFPGGWEGDAVNLFDPAQRDAVQAGLFDYTQRLFQWRKSKPVIHNGRTMHFLSRDNTYAYFRYDDTDAVFVFINNSRGKKQVPWSHYAEIASGLSDGRNVLTGEATEVDDTTTVGPRQALIVEFKRK